MKVLLLGGGGFIGSSVLERLIKAAHQVRVFERPRIAPYRRFGHEDHVQWVFGDLFSVSDIDAAMNGVDVVIHLISSTLPKNSNADPIHDVQSNIVGALSILNAMVTQKVPRIIFASSGGTVYGRPQYIPIDEQHPTEPLVSYGIAKLCIEKYLALYESMHGIRSIVLRVSNPYGERQRIETAQGAVGAFCSRALRAEPIEVWGDGSVTRDYVYVGDVAEAFRKAMHYTGSCKVFNIGSGIGTPLLELLEMIGRELKAPIVPRFLPGRPFDVPVNILDNSLAKSELDWNPVVPLQDGLAVTIDWLRRNMRP